MKYWYSITGGLGSLDEYYFKINTVTKYLFQINSSSGYTSVDYE